MEIKHLFKILLYLDTLTNTQTQVQQQCVWDISSEETTSSCRTIILSSLPISPSTELKTPRWSQNLSSTAANWWNGHCPIYYKRPVEVRAANADAERGKIEAVQQRRPAVAHILRVQVWLCMHWDYNNVSARVQPTDTAEFSSRCWGCTVSFQHICSTDLEMKKNVMGEWSAVEHETVTL